MPATTADPQIMNALKTLRTVGVISRYDATYAADEEAWRYSWWDRDNDKVAEHADADAATTYARGALDALALVATLTPDEIGALLHSLTVKDVL